MEKVVSYNPVMRTYSFLEIEEKESRERDRSELISEEEIKTNENGGRIQRGRGNGGRRR